MIYRKDNVDKTKTSNIGFKTNKINCLRMAYKINKRATLENRLPDGTDATTVDRYFGGNLTDKLIR